VRRRRHWRHLRDDAGLTLLELIITIAIMGVLTVPMADFVLQYFATYSDTQTRLSDSHDLQIAAAYFSQDVANTGLRSAATNNPVQSIWTPASGFPATYCGSTLGGSTMLLLSWDDWTTTPGGSGSTGVDAPDSVAYVVVNGTLVRAYCDGGTALTSSTTVAHDLAAPDTDNPTPVTVTCPAGPCSAAPPPASVQLTIGIKGKTDTAISLVTLTGQRRQAAT
jgi:prepilin-type N-terminal cleavage/methylation domain-containing protein